MLVEIVLDFPFTDVPTHKFSMEMSRIPQKGEWIGQLDGQFGTKYRQFVKEIEQKCRFVFGCYPQYVENIGYRDGKYVLNISCNPNNYILSWESLKDKRLCLIETKTRPHVGDWIMDDRGKSVCITYVTLIGYNLISVDVAESEPSKNNAELSYDVNSIANDVRDLIKRVDDIYHQIR